MLSTMMNAPTSPREIEPPQLAGTAKAIADLDLLVRALLASMPSSKPWQRQIRSYLAESDRHLQVLRLTIAMKRGDAEVEQSASELVKSLRVANAYTKAGRADMATKHAIQLGFGLGQRVCAATAGGRSSNVEGA
jgi:hypothetical protein